MYVSRSWGWETFYLLLAFFLLACPRYVIERVRMFERIREEWVCRRNEWRMATECIDRNRMEKEGKEK